MQIQRLFEITYILLRKKRVTAKELAQHFEVCTRTIYRDLDALSMAGIPLYTNKGNNGGIFLMEDYTISKSLLNDEEQQHLLSALQSYHLAENSDISSLLTKLSAQFQKEQQIWIDADFSEWGNNSSSYFQLLKEAILNRKVVHFTYYNSNGQCKERDVEPLRLIFKGQSWYFVAFCLDTQDQRLFKLNRMKHLKQLNLEATHEIEETSLKNLFHYQKKDLVSIIAKVDATLAYRVYDEFTPEQYSKQEDGSLLLKMAFPQGEWIYSYLMGFGPNLQVIEPTYIKEELIKRYRQALTNYEVVHHEYTL